MSLKSSMFEFIVKYPSNEWACPLVSYALLFVLVLLCNADGSTERLICHFPLSLSFLCRLHHRACSILTVFLGKVKWFMMMIKVSDGFKSCHAPSPPGKQPGTATRLMFMILSMKLYIIKQSLYGAAAAVQRHLKFKMNILQCLLNHKRNGVRLCLFPSNTTSVHLEP